MSIASIFFVLAFLIPNHYLPWMSFYSEFLAFLGLLVVGAYLVKYEIKVGYPALFFLCLSLVPLVQLFFGVVFFAGDAWMAAFYLLGCGAAIVFGRKLFELHGEYSYALFAWVFLLASIVSAGFSLYQWFGLSEGLWILVIPEGGRVTGNLAQSNHLATLLSLGLASALYLRESRLLGRGGSGLIAFTLIVALVLTQSRTPWIGAVCLVLWWSINYRKAGLVTRPSVLLLWLLFYVLTVYFLADVKGILGIEVSPDELKDRALSAQRLPLWGQVVSAIGNGPIWGYGWNQVGVAQVSAALDYPVESLSLHSHNIALDLLVWNGPVLGGIAITLISIWLVIAGLRATKQGSVFALLCVGLLILHGLLEYPLEYAYFLLPLCFLLGMVEEELGCPCRMRIPRLFLGAPLVAMVWGMSVIWLEYRVVEEDHRVLRFEMSRVGDLKAEQAAPDVVLLTQLREVIRLARVEIGAKTSEEELDWMRSVAYRYPYVPCLYRYAMALALNDRADESIDVLRRLHSIYGDEIFQSVRAGIEEQAAISPQLAALNERLADI